MAVATAAALAGAADAGTFLASRRRLFREAPQRAWGTVAFSTLWLALAQRSAREAQSSAATVAIAGTLAAGNAAMLAVHLRHRIASPRVFAGAALSGVALADVLRRR